MRSHFSNSFPNPISELVSEPMEQPCYKCGQAVDQGRPFCPHCAAPQIRVVMPEPAAARPAAQENVVTQSQDLFQEPQGVPLAALPMQWSQAVKPCAIAAVVGSLLIVLGLNIFVGLLSVGFLAVVICRQMRPGMVNNAVGGTRVGLLSGLISFAVTFLPGALAVLIPESRAKLQQQMLENAQKFAVAHPDFPALRDAMAQYQTGPGFVAVLVIAAFLLLIFSIVLGALGGALGARLLGRRGPS